LANSTPEGKTAKLVAAKALFLINSLRRIMFKILNGLFIVANYDQTYKK
jgi:hypothetical protein